MEWFEDNSETESWVFNFDDVMSEVDVLQRINDSAHAGDSQRMIQILTSRLMKREVTLELKKLGLEVCTLSEVISDDSSEFEMVQPLLEKYMVFMIAVNESEHDLLKKKISEFTEEGIPVMMFSSTSDAMNQLNCG